MSFINEAMAAATMSIPAADTPDEQQKVFDAMPMAELADVWRALQGCGYRDRTEGMWAAFYYFDSLPHQNPERALDLILEVLRRETDISVLLQLGDKFTLALMNTHGEKLIGRLEREAKNNARLRWLLGSVIYWTDDEAQQARLEAIADQQGWRDAADAHDERNPLIDFDSLSSEEIAQIWISQNGCPVKDRDRNWSALRDYERDLREQDPARALAIILAVLERETNTQMLSYLAAGPLEDLITMDTIDMIEAEAKRNDRFKMLLGGVWYSSAPDELKARLDAIIQGAHW
ncbi:DUF6869 domain-containing protein [Pseudorhodoplanes sinuspersici]|uniref:DUF6869 domain-containing protein n=1 Tax=Pseudorhodoplanes sinuspersici TaxID=1235591 RepID=A0A1W6ZLW8_9HYPH|nr:hypothetical protein [Pseudorhodoplanes sinuspersici]ARP98349.1 hypothetical protein CAK95_04030 [Pseudorhodoplanes sinuspersici]RKE66008.1 hypothetical protein DFP91_5582 [Pseudorhodoplanes sinuspersici]